MTTGSSGVRRPTDEQLADILRFIARTCLEVERGLRPSAHLRSFMDPDLRWTELGQLGRFPYGGPVQDGQIGHPQISRLSDTHVIATIVTRTEGDRWGALTLRLHAKRGRWHITDLHRVLATTHYHNPPKWKVTRSPDDMRREIAEDRRAANAAHRASKLRLSDLTPDTPEHRAAHDLVGYWQRKLGEFDRELANLHTRQQTLDFAEHALRR